MNRYTLEKLIGDGSTSKVYKAINIRTFQVVAIKLITNRDYILHNNGEKEVKAILRLKHPHIVELYEYVSTPLTTYFVFEYAQLGDLLEYINNTPYYLDLPTVHNIFCQLLSAIEYIHQTGYIHCDLKPENILLFPRPGLTPKDCLQHKNFLVKLADFGFATPWSPDRYINMTKGSINYASPELLLRIPCYGPEIDVWSLGIVLYSLLFHRLPFILENKSYSDVTKIYHQLSKKGPPFPYAIPFSLRFLLTQMLEVQPNKRITIREILNFSWVRNPGFSARDTLSRRASDMPLSASRCPSV